MPDGVIIPGGPSFSGHPQPPDVPCDPTGDAWVGPPGPPGPPGPAGPAGGLTGGTMTGPLYWTTTGTTTSRAAQDRSHDWIDVLDFGAKLDGTTSDNAAFQAALNATPDDGAIVVPRGGWNVGALTRASGNVLWKLDGNRFGTGTTPVQYAGVSGDVTETFTSGRKAFYGQATTTTPFAVAEVALNFNNPSGIAAVSSGLYVTAAAAANSGSTFVWAVNANCTSNSNGPNQNIAGAFTTRKNGTSPCFALFAQGVDQTGLPSSTGGNYVTCEMDLFANQLDDLAAGGRMILNLVYNKANTGNSANPMSIHTGLGIGPQTGSGGSNISCDRLIALSGTYNQSAIDTRNGTQGAGANAIWLGDNQTIALDTAGSHTIQWRTATSRWYFSVGGVDMWSVDASGNVRARGTVTGSTTP